MAVDFSGSQYYRRDQTLVTAVPFTMHCLAWPDVVNTEQHMMSINDNNGIELHNLGFGVPSQNARPGASSYDSGWAASRWGINITAGSWYAIGGVWSASNNRLIYLDGVAGTANTTTKNPSGIDNLTIGSQWFSGSVQNEFNGKLAECAIWDAALTAGEMKALGQHVSPRLIRPQNLVFYLPLWRHTDSTVMIELVQGGNWGAASGSTSVHPRVFYPPAQVLRFPVPASGANNASGSPSITAITSSGAAKRDLPASGTPSITAITSAGAADKTLSASGTPSITAPTSAGEAKRDLPASGTPSIDAITSSGTAKRDLPASGTPSITAITSAGEGTVTAANTASGTPSITAITSSGAAVRNLPASGTPSIDAITSSGVATKTLDATGSPSITAITSSGASVKNLPASGTPSITAITSAGEANVGVTHTAEGTPSITAITSSGAATKVLDATGSPSITAITSSGASVKTLGASGAPSITAITSSGVGTGSSAVLVGTQIPGEPATEPYDPGIPTDTETPYDPTVLDNFDIGTLEVSQVVGLPEQLLICDRTGFKIPVKMGLVYEWDGFMVRQGSWEPRHPQDFLRGRPETEQKGSPRPEPDDDIFLDTNEVSVDDL